MGTSSRSELDTRTQQQEVVAELGQQALEDDDIGHLMHDATVAIAETLGNDYCKVLELLPGGDEVFLKHGVGWQDGLVGNATVPTDLDSQAGYTLISEEPVIVDDLETETRFSGPDLLTDHDVVSGISVIIGSVDDPWGILGTHTTERREFTEHDASFVQNVANILASAIESERAHSQLEEMYGRISDAFFSLDDEWRFTHLNERAEELLTPDGQSLVGKHIWEEFPDAIHRKFKEKYEQAMYEQETVSFEEHYPEPVDAWFEVRAYPSDTGLSVYFTDITERKEYERQLEESEGRYRTLVDNFPNGAVALVDDDLHYKAIGGDPEVTGNTTVADAEGKLVKESIPSQLAEDLVPCYEAALDGEKSSFEAEFGDQIFEFQIVPVRDDDGEIFAALGMSQDITERRAVQRELRESEAKFRLIAEQLEEVVWMATADGEEWVYINPAFEDIWGRDRDELYGDTLTFLDTVHQEDRERIREAFTTLPDDPIDEEFRIVRPDGETRWIHVRGGRVHDEDSETTRLLGIGEDITERVERERQLEESERRYRTLAEHFPNGAVGVYDRDLRYTLAKGASISERLPSSDRLEGSRVPEIFPSRTVADIEPLFRAAIEDGTTDSVVTELGGRHWRVWATPLRDADGDTFAGMSFTQDITEQVERQQRLEELVDQLEASNERLEQFAYAASHDLQEPLRMVSSYLQLIEDRYADELDEDGREFIDFAVDGADRMRNMIEGLLKYSRVDTRGDPFEPTDLNDVLAAVRDDLQVKIDEADAEITADPLPEVVGDAGQLRQVFQNLVDNAIEYSGDDPPSIHVSAERHGDEWVISVSDEGIGIDPDDADRVFEVFQRLHSTEDYSGTGIGLALCERIVERHDGEIWVEAEPDGGSTFTFTLPTEEE